MVVLFLCFILLTMLLIKLAVLQEIFFTLAFFQCSLIPIFFFKTFQNLIKFDNYITKNHTFWRLLIRTEPHYWSICEMASSKDI